MEEALPVPGGIGLGIRDEGRGREVRQEDEQAIYVARSTACLRCIPLAASRVVTAHCAPLMSSSPAMWAEACCSIASIVWQVAEKRDWMP
ncbi:MAG: hypothetical protein ACLR7Z_22065 [Bilophila wadsworthia]